MSAYRDELARKAGPEPSYACGALSAGPIEFLKCDYDRGFDRDCRGSL